MSETEGTEQALDCAFRYGQIQGDHHRAWVIDQMVRALTGAKYSGWVKEYENDGEYGWDTGIAP